MEAWEALLEGYNGPPDIATFSKVMSTAETVLKEDLAAFEIEWIASTLLYAPISVLELVRAQRNDGSWSKPLTDAFKIISTLVEKYPNSVVQYHDDIVKVCQLGLEARVRAAALHCLAGLVTRSLAGVSVHAYVEELHTAPACKAPLAALLGVICEHHPKQVESLVNSILRGYLGLLDSNKVTDTVRCAALVGISKLLRHHGSALLLTDLELLYASLTKDLTELSTATHIILDIFSAHARLFRERLSLDAVLRRTLWAGAEAEAKAGAGWPSAIRAVYDAALPAMTQAQIQEALDSEVYPRATSRLTAVKLTSLRVLSLARALCPVRESATDIDVYELEFRLRTHDNVTEEVAHTALFCVERRLPHSDVLLQTAILNHSRLSPARVKDIVTCGLDHDEDDTHLSFLITESCRDGGIERYSELWSAIAEHGGARKLVRYLTRVLVEYTRGESVEMPESLVPLLRLSARVLPGVSNASFETLAVPLCAFINRASVTPAPALLLLPLLPSDCHDVINVYRSLDVERAADEETLCACALAVLHASCAALPARRLAAAQVVLSRSDAEPAQLRLALLSLENLLVEESVDPEQLAETMRAARRLRARTDLVGAEARELQRDLLMFLGRHWCSRYEPTGGSELDALAIKLRDHLSITVPELNGIDQKIYLKKILPLAVELEDRPSLEALTAVICAHPECNVASPCGEALRGALAHVLGAQARGVARGAGPAPPTPAIPALAPLLLQHIARGTAGERRVLCRIMSPLLEAPVLQQVAEEVCNMLATGSLRAKLAALDTTPTLIKALSNNSIEAGAMTPRLLLLIATTNERASIAPFQQASTLYLRMRELFGADALNNTANDLIKLITQMNIDVYETYKSIVSMIVEFLKKLLEDPKEVVDKVLRAETDPVRCLYILAVVKKMFGLNKKIVTLNLANKLFNLKGTTEFEREAGLLFVTEFAEVLPEEDKEACVSWVRRSLASLPPACPSLRRWPACVLRLRAALGPNALLRECAPSLEAWTEAQPLEEIGDSIRWGSVWSQRACVEALRVLLEAFSPPHVAHMLPRTHELARHWPATVSQLYADTTDKEQLEMWYLMDAVAVGLRCSSADDIKRLLLAPQGISFCKDFMPAFYRYLTRPPFLLCERDMRDCSVLLRDIMSHATRAGVAEDGANVLRLTDELWDTFAEVSTAARCGEVVAGALKLGAAETARCVQWALLYVEGPGQGAARGELLYALPTGDAADAAMKAFCQSMPARLRECRGAHARSLRGVLDAAAGTPRPVLLDFLDKMAAGDETAGWWDSAMEACMTSLALRADVDVRRADADVAAGRRADEAAELLAAVWARANRHALSVGPTMRLVMPLVSNSPPSVCEQFFARLLPDLLAPTLRSPEDGAYHRCVVQNIRRVVLLRLMAEKVPRGSLESPGSALHRQLGNAARPWHAVREACKLCVTLQARVTAPAASERDGRLFQQHAYAALCALGLAWRCDDRIFTPLLNWDRLVDDAPIDLPIRSKWARGTVVTSVAGGGDATSGGGGGGVSASVGGSSRPRVFLRTLSECPLNFDMFDMDEESERVELVMSESRLNRLPSSGPLTQLLRHLSASAPAAADESAPAPAWLTAVCETLRSGRTNVRWLLAQCVINVRECVSSYSGTLAPALLATVLHTEQLNQLHVDILETIAAWGGEVPPPGLEQAATMLLRDCATQQLSRQTLLQCATTLFKAFPGVQVGWGHLKTLIDSNDAAAKEVCWKVLLKASKAGAVFPGLAQEIVDRIQNPSNRNQLTSLAKLFGALSGGASEAQLRAYHQAAARARASDAAQYLNMLYFAGATDYTHFNAVADLAQKMPSSRKRCVEILSAIVSANKSTDKLADLPPDLQAELWEQCTDMAFEEACSSSADPPPQKRARLSAADSALLATRSYERKFARVLSKLTDRDDKLDSKLSNDMAVRFVECFYVCVNLSTRCPSASTADMLKLLLRKTRAQPRYKLAALPTVEYAIDTDADARTARVGTLRTQTAARNARSSHVPRVSAAPSASEALTIEQALDAFLNFGKSQASVSAYLCSQVYRACSPRAELASLLADLLADVLATRGMLRLATELVPCLTDLQPLSEIVAQLSQQWAGSEMEAELRLLQQEIRLRSPAVSLFVLGINSEEEDVKSADENFTIHGLVRAFGKLSNWATLTLRERRSVVSTLPPLWASYEDFQRELVNYTVGDDWFSCMVRAFRGERNGTRWLRLASAYPVKQFQLSAVTEAIRHVSGAAPGLSTPVPGDCLAEWAARLMVRSLYLQETMEAEEARALSRSHELQWCRRATEMELYNEALQCIRRNTREELLESETLAWVCARARAMRGAARDKDGDMSEESRDRLRRELETAETHGPSYFEASPLSDVIEYNLLVLLLRIDLEILTDENVDAALTAVEDAIERHAAGHSETERDAVESDEMECYKDNLREICEIAVQYYDDTWDDRDTVDSATAMRRVLSLCRASAARVLCRLSRQRRRDDDATRLLVDTLAPVLDSLPAYCSEWARSLHAPSLPSLHDDKQDKLRRSLQLLCGAEPTLLHHCNELLNANDAAAWSRAFLNMRAEVFENELAGADYHALHQHKRPLNEIQEYLDTTEGASLRRSTLRNIVTALRQPRARRSVRALCPSLSNVGREDKELTEALEALLGISGVEAIEDEIAVFTDAVSSPGVVRVRTSADARRFLVKRERLARDRAARAAAAALAPPHRLPAVILLSEECGLIEYLEDHERLRDLIAERVDLDRLPIERQARKNDELILAPPAVAEKNFASICDKVPNDALRRAIESRSASVEDFLIKQQRFKDDLISMTLVSWLLGLGDRHLNNIMYSTVEGGVLGVDWGALNQYGINELPPARLTPQLLAVCADGIEAGLQRAVSSLRERRRRITPILHLALTSAGCQDQVSTVQELVSGVATSRDVTRRRVLSRDAPHARRYDALLHDLCPHVADKQTYSVEEQVSSLLVQCTSRRVLAVTRSEWEPWL